MSSLGYWRSFHYPLPIPNLKASRCRCWEPWAVEWSGLPEELAGDSLWKGESLEGLLGWLGFSGPMGLSEVVGRSGLLGPL